MATRHIRKRLWINPAFQGRLLLHIGSNFLFYLIFISVLGFLLFLQEALMAKQIAPSIELCATYLTKLRPLFLATAILMPYFIYDLIKFSHRVAGPLYRCQKTMRDLVEGKPVQEFRPRPRDLMPEFFADFDVLIKAHNARIAASANGQSPSEQPEEVAAQHV